MFSNIAMEDMFYCAKTMNDVVLQSYVHETASKNNSTNGNDNLDKNDDYHDNSLKLQHDAINENVQTESTQKLIHIIGEQNLIETAFDNNNIDSSTTTIELLEGLSVLLCVFIVTF